MASAGADEKKQSSRSPQENVVLLEKEFANKAVLALVNLLDNDDYATRAAAQLVLRARASEELKNKKPLVWKHLLSLEGKSAEQKQSLGSILNFIEGIERSFWWEPTMMQFDANEKQQMATLKGALEVLQKKMDCKLVFHATQAETMLGAQVTNIPDGGQFWQVLRTLRVGDKQIVPFLSDGALYLMLEDAALPTASDGSMYAILQPFDDNSDEMRVYGEPKAFSRDTAVTLPRQNRQDLLVPRKEDRHQTFLLPRSRSGGPVSVDVHVTGSLVQKHVVKDSSLHILQVGGNTYVCSGLPQEQDVHGNYFISIDEPEVKDPHYGQALHANFFDEAGKPMSMGYTWPKNWFKNQGFYWIAKKRPARAEFFLLQPEVGRATRRLTFENTPAAALPEF